MGGEGFNQNSAMPREKWLNIQQWWLSSIELMGAAHHQVIPQISGANPKLTYIFIAQNAISKKKSTQIVIKTTNHNFFVVFFMHTAEHKAVENFIYTIFNKCK